MLILELSDLHTTYTIIELEYSEFDHILIFAHVFCIFICFHAINKHILFQQE